MTDAVRSEIGGAGGFLGRERELRVLLDGLDQARTGRGILFLVGGEPGIGKSRLADEFANRAREGGARVVWGRCWEGGGAPAYWPWVQALRLLLRSLGPAAARELMGMGAADLAQMLPELRSVAPDLRPASADSESARFQLFDSTAAFLQNAARVQELVLVLDDLQAADTPSILLLRFVAGQLSDTRMLLVATYRDVELTPDHPLSPAVAEMARERSTVVLPLTGLPEEAVTAFVEATSGRAPHSQLASGLWRQTGGNPLFLGEAVRLLAAEGRLDEAAVGGSLRLSMPAGIRDVINRRVGHLGEATVRAMAYGAMLGPEFSVESVRRVGGYEAGELLDRLGEAVSAGLLVPVSGALGRFRFSHDLVREALYDGLSPSERVRLHRQIAETLEDIYGSSVDAHLAELAHHYFEAARGGATDDLPDGATRATDQAKSYARRAGDVAARSLAYEEAVRLYRMALELLSLDTSADEQERAQLLLALGDAQARAGDLPTSRRTFLDAAGIARRTGSAGELARAALGYGGRFPWARAGDDQHAIPLLQDALVALGGSDERLRVRLLTRLACSWRDASERRDQSAALSQQAVDMARQLADPSTLSYALTGRYWAAWWPENAEERLELAREMLAVAESVGDAERTIDAHLTLYMTHTELARMGEARIEFETVRRLAEELRQPAQLWLGWALLALLALLEGDYQRAEEAMQHETEPGHPTTPIRDDVSAARMHRFLLRREQGRLAEEEATVRASAAEFPWYPLHRAALACLLLELGRPTEARAVFDDLAEGEFRAFNRDNEWLLGIALASEACAALADREAAATMYDQLLPFAGRHSIGHAEGSVGAVDRYLGLLALTLGRLDDAARHLEAGIALNQRMGARPWTAHSQYDLARVLRQRDGRGNVQRAQELERAALETARQLGMSALLSRLREPGDESAPAPAASPDDRLAGAFRREGEYWTVTFGSDSFRVRDSKGMQYLARLLAQPGREILALDLVQESAPAEARGAVSREPDVAPATLGDAGAQLDAEAKQAYRQRLQELRAEQSEAEAWNDPERVARAREEIEFLARELARAVGLGNRDRSAASATERARLSVTRAIRAAMSRIAQHSSALGEHLETTIHTGTYCAYRPDSRFAISWEI